MERAAPSPSFDDSYLQEEVECVASHFVVVGIQPGLLQPLLPVEEGCEDVLTDVCIVLPSKGEECPAGYTLIESSLNTGSTQAQHSWQTATKAAGRPCPESDGVASWPYASCGLTPRGSSAKTRLAARA